MDGKKVLQLNRYEYGIIINSLNNFRTTLIREKRTTDAVDELMQKVIKSPVKKMFLGKIESKTFRNKNEAR